MSSLGRIGTRVSLCDVSGPGHRETIGEINGSVCPSKWISCIPAIDPQTGNVPLIMGDSGLHRHCSADYWVILVFRDIVLLTIG